MLHDTMASQTPFTLCERAIRCDEFLKSRAGDLKVCCTPQSREARAKLSVLSHMCFSMKNSQVMFTYDLWRLASRVRRLFKIIKLLRIFYEEK